MPKPEVELIEVDASRLNIPNRRAKKQREKADNINIPSGNLIVCMTGKYHITRDDLIRRVQNMGHDATTNANQADILVCSDPSSNTIKARTARNREIPIVSYEQFFD